MPYGQTQRPFFLDGLFFLAFMHSLKIIFTQDLTIQAKGSKWTGDALPCMPCPAGAVAS
jgi:hypothetical protein